MSTVKLTADNSDVYYTGHYWNSYSLVIEAVNRRVGGTPDKNWYEHFAGGARRRKFAKALFLNCGNGWLERQIFDSCELFEEAVGIDCSEELLAEARENTGDRPLRYYAMDTNQADFPEDGYDLVVNHAAFHHIAYLDRVLRELCRLLPEDGYLINYDYVGPHRNQYPYEHWHASWLLNEQLPVHLRKDMKYPHLPTMLATDPTEAIHSELFVETLGRYFSIEEHKHAGGTLAYEILTFNDNMQQATSEEQELWIRFILDKDLEFVEATGVSYFDYIVCKPNKSALVDDTKLRQYEQEENQREESAAAAGGVYYEESLLQSLYSQIANTSVAGEHSQAYIGDLHRLIDGLRRELKEAQAFQGSQAKPQGRLNRMARFLARAYARFRQHET